MAVKPKGATDPASRIEAMIATQERRFRRVFQEAIALILDEYTLSELADLLEAGKLEEALEAVDRAAIKISNSYGEALSQSARDTAAWLSTSALTVEVSFDQTNYRAVAIMQENKLRLIREFSAEQKAAVRQALTEGIKEGANPREQARNFRNAIGLTRKQEAAVRNYRRMLEGAGRGVSDSSEALERKLRDRRFDRSVARAIRDGKPLTKAQVDLMVGRYRERYIKYRAEVIGRTEALRAVHQGTQEMYRQAVEQGAMSSTEYKHKWVSARDKRVRDSHRHLNGLVRMEGETFPGNDGALKYPGDPDAPASETVQCRCCLSTRLDPE